MVLNKNRLKIDFGGSWRLLEASWKPFSPFLELLGSRKSKKRETKIEIPGGLGAVLALVGRRVGRGNYYCG